MITKVSPKRAVLTSLTALSLLGCAAPDDLELDDLDDSQELRALDSAALIAAACVPERQVAWVDNAAWDCADIGAWQGAHLFSNGGGDLAHYCVFKWQGVGDPDVTVLDEISSDHDADCNAVLEQSGDPLSSAIASNLQAAFHDAINRPDPADLEVDFDPSEPLRSPVTVSVIDTIPNPAPAVPNSEHGESMAAFVRDIACPDPAASCAVDVRNRLGMPRVQGGSVDVVNGGVFGGQADLAFAIYRAVVTRTPGEPLIINLSLGWNEEVFGGAEGSPNPMPAKAVYAALQFARCNGALIIAAAGNESEACSTGPLAPGAWERKAAPTQAQCAELGVDNPVLSSTSVYSPLIYAVGGLDYDDQPFALSRAAAMPRLAATALHAIPDVAQPRTALSGTSVSAAVVSGAAALVWSYFPVLEPDQVMRSIYMGGHSLGVQADFTAPDVGATAIRAVDVCGALEHARQRDNTPFIDFDLGCLSEDQPPFEAVFEELAGLPTQLWEPTFPQFKDKSCASECGATGTSYTAQNVGPGACPLPPDQSARYTEPQPTHPACPSCTLDTGGGKVLASLDLKYAGMTVSDVTVTMLEGDAKTYFRLGEVPLSYDKITEIKLDPTKLPTAADSAYIDITFVDTKPNRSELLVK